MGRIEVDLLVSKDVELFRRVEQWNFAAPSCSVNLNGDGILEDYPPDNFCAKKKNTNTNTKTNSDGHAYPTVHNLRHSDLWFGGGSLFHHIAQNNEHPYQKTTLRVMAPTSGRLLWAQSHLHTGGINATLYKNDKPVCTTSATYGTNSDAGNNARNEKNHLVRIGSCYDQIGSEANTNTNTNTNNNNNNNNNSNNNSAPRHAGISFEEGDVFTTETYYYGGTDDDRFSTPLAAGEHKNVMSMFFLGVVLDGSSSFLTRPRTSFNLWNDFVHVADIQQHTLPQQQQQLQQQQQPETKATNHIHSQKHQHHSHLRS